MENKKITEKEISKKLNSINFEFKFGSKFTSIIGILLIMTALIYGSYLTYNFFSHTISNTAKTIAIYLVGLSLLGVAEKLKTSVKKSYYTTLLAGGIGVLYLATGVGYFVFDNVLSGLTVLILVCTISITSFLLATKKDAKVVAIFALIGGAMPIIDLNFSTTIVTALSIYILGLNLLALLVSVNKNWIEIKYFTLIINFLSTSTLIINIFFNDHWHYLMIVLYITIVYLMVLAIIVYYKLKHSLEITTFEKVFISINTFIYSSAVFILFGQTFPNRLGYCALLLFAFYFSLSRAIEKYSKGQNTISNIFITTAFIYWFITIPVQFQGRIVIISLIVQSASLVCTGIYKNNKLFKILGSIAMIIAINAILMFDDLVFNLGIYLACNIFIIATIYYVYWDNLYKLSSKNKKFTIYKIILMYCIYAYCFFSLQELSYHIDFPLNLNYVIFFLLTSCITIILMKLKFLHDFIFKSNMLLINAILCVLLFSTPVVSYTKTQNLIMLFLMILCKLVYLFSLKLNLYKTLLNKDYIYTILLGISIPLLTISFVQFDYFESQSYYFSILALLLTFSYIIFGFIHNYATLRKVMLVTTYSLLVKIFIFDLNYNSGVNRVIAYFSFGVVLLIISYIYQKFSNKIYKDISIPKQDKSLGDDYIEKDSCSF